MAKDLASVTPTPGSVAVPAAAGVQSSRGFHLDSRYVAPIFVTCLLLAGQLQWGVLESFPQTLLAIAAAIITEIVLSKYMTGKWPNVASAYISGISVGILLRSTDYWPFALCSMIAISSKYVIRIKGRHVWNPSNFAIVMMLCLAWNQVATLSQQWDNRSWAMLVIWFVGAIIIWRLKRFHICATYVISFIVFSFVRSIINHQPVAAEIAPITGPMYQLFIFFMITDPKTTVHSKRGQCVVAFLVAFMEMCLRLNQNIHAPYWALFMVGPPANLLEIWLLSRRKAEVPAPAAPKLASAQP